MADNEDIKTPLEETPPERRPHLLRRVLLILFVVLIVLAAAGVLVWHFRQPSTSVVPAAVRNSVSFPVYYPAPAKLPAGYTLDSSSFRQAPGGAVVYRVVTAKGESLTFSEVATPSQDVINKFLTASIPLHNDLQTRLGKAEIGVAGSGNNMTAVVSLPITRGPWVIITAPQDVGQADLQKVIQAVQK